jgi:hypothetical protein
MHRLELPAHNETAPQRLVDGLDLKVWRERVVGDDVEERPQRCGHADAVNRLNVSFVESCMVQPEHRRDGSHPSKSGRHGHVQLRRHHVGQIVHGQRGSVAVHTLRLALPIPRPKLPDHEVRPGRGWELRQPVHTPSLADPVAGAHLVGVDAVVVASVARLAGGKETALGFRRFVELSECNWVTWHAIKP